MSNLTESAFQYFVGRAKLLLEKLPDDPWYVVHSTSVTPGVYCEEFVLCSGRGEDQQTIGTYTIEKPFDDVPEEEVEKQRKWAREDLEGIVEMYNLLKDFVKLDTSSQKEE